MSTDRVMLSTVDNPWNPFTHFDQWYAYDQEAGHYSTELLGRVVHSSIDLSEQDQELLYEAGIDEIIRENVSGVHVKVYAPENSGNS